MLTKQDLKDIESLLASTEERVSQGTEEANLEIQKEIILLKAEMKREFRKVHNDQNLIIKHFNVEFLDLQERVEKLEQKVKPSSFS